MTFKFAVDVWCTWYYCFSLNNDEQKRQEGGGRGEEGRGSDGRGMGRMGGRRKKRELSYQGNEEQWAMKKLT